MTSARMTTTHWQIKLMLRKSLHLERNLCGKWLDATNDSVSWLFASNTDPLLHHDVLWRHMWETGYEQAGYLEDPYLIKNENSVNNVKNTHTHKKNLIQIYALLVHVSVSLDNIW